MTSPRAKIEASLAERGRPVLWANEQEAASMCGIGIDAFRLKVRELESYGFPQVNRLNGKRYIPAIIAFWASQVDMPAIAAAESEDRDGPEVENFGNGQAQRRSA